MIKNKVFRLLFSPFMITIFVFMAVFSLFVVVIEGIIEGLQEWWDVLCGAIDDIRRYGLYD